MVRIDGDNTLLPQKNFTGRQKILPYSEISEKVLSCCFELMRELGPGFLEKVYKNALAIVMRQNGLKVVMEKKFDIEFRNHNIGQYFADIIVEDLMIVELKCCKVLAPENQAQLINYLKTSRLPVGLLVNFGNPKLEYKRVHHPDFS